MHLIIEKNTVKKIYRISSRVEDEISFDEETRFRNEMEWNGMGGYWVLMKFR